MSNPVQRIGESEFDDSNSGRPGSGSRWVMRIPSVWSSDAGFITGPTNFWMTDDSMIQHGRSYVSFEVHETCLPVQLFLRSQGFMAISILKGIDEDAYVMERHVESVAR